jgi:hypothetical protein
MEEAEATGTSRKCRLLQASMIGEDGNLLLDDSPVFASSQDALQVGDICLAAQAATRKGRTLVITPKHPPLRAGSDLLVIRSKEPSQPQPDYALLLQAYLASNKAAALCPALKEGGATRASLEELPVPFPDDVFWDAWNRLEQARAEFTDWTRAAEREKQFLFEFDSPEHQNSSIRQVGRQVRLARIAASLTKKLSNRVRRYFPYPLAYRYSQLESSFEDSEGLQNALEAAEVLIQYLSILALVESRLHSLSIPKWEELLKAWGEGLNKGLTFGDYYSFLQEISESPAWRDKTDQLHFQEVQQFFAKAEVKPDIRWIMDCRNDAAHLRRSRGSKLIEQFQQARLRVERLYEASEFLAEWPLVLVEKTMHDSFYGSTEVQMRELKGDQPLVSVERSKVAKGNMESGSLYVRHHGGELFLMRPLIVWAECPECRVHESFCLDKVDSRRGLCECKSLELGHSLVSESIFQAFQRSHMLSQQGES